MSTGSGHMRVGKRRRAVVRLVIAGLVVVLAGTATAGAERRARDGHETCPRLEVSPGYVRSVQRALRAKEDVWGNALLAHPGGPTYAGVRRYLKPLLLARGPGGMPLTQSGFQYLAFTQPSGAEGSGTAALHVADGSQIVSKRFRGPALTIGVGIRGRERYGSCLSRLATPRLAGGYLPILQTRYSDSEGARYAQESFAARVPGTAALVSFIRLTADARTARSDIAIRFTPTETGLAVEGDTLVGGDDMHAIFSSGGVFDGSAVSYDLPTESRLTAYVARLNTPTSTTLRTLDRAGYESARASVIRYWQHRLAEGATIEVPERRVRDAARNLLIQNLGLSWRYSVGNPYQEFSFPEGLDVAQVTGAYGFDGEARAILRRSLETPRGPYPNWRIGQKLVGSALYHQLSRDHSYIAQVTPVLRGYVESLGGQIGKRRRGMLERERYSSDIPDLVYGLHSQAVVWQGLEAMARVWEDIGLRPLAARCRKLAARLEVGLRRAILASQRRLPDGSLFLPVRLLDSERPYDSVTALRSGSYWNLVVPYALASGLFAPRSREADGVLRYMSRHGSRLLGLVRAGAYSLYGKHPVPPASGVNPVYGLNVTRFLADNDRPDQLVLSLYGQLAAAMTPGTFVAGEAVSVAPLAGDYYRSTYLPPNGASNASFLETLRLMLVHETRDRDGAARGLELAYATPRAWLAPRRSTTVRNLPTSFGQISFSITSLEDTVRVSIDVPGRSPPPTLRLRLRLPPARHIARALLNGCPFRQFDPATETLDLSGRTGRLELVVEVGST